MSLIDRIESTILNLHEDAHRLRHGSEFTNAEIADSLETVAYWLKKETTPEQQARIDAMLRGEEVEELADKQAPVGWDAEFLSKRLGRVAKLAGVTMPEMTHDKIAEVAGTILGTIARQLEKQSLASSKWIDPNDKTQNKFLPWIGESVLFCHDGLTYYGQHTGGSFQTRQGVTARHFNTWECRWMYPPVAAEAEAVQQ